MADALRGLLLGADGAAAQQLPATAMRAAALLGAREMVLYLVDYGQLALVPMAAPGTPERDVLPIEGTLAGRVYVRTEMQQSADASGERLWIPLLDGTERLGVLEVCTTAGEAARSRADFEAVAGLFAGLVSTGRAYSDQVELTRRRIPMQLAAEIVWSLLPPSTFANAQVTISGILEPCYDVGGDAFDYAVNGDVLHAAIFDTVGHGIEACALTSLTVSAYRNARRCGLDLVDTYR